jgi:hypothetical protein
VLEIGLEMNGKFFPAVLCAFQDQFGATILNPETNGEQRL